ncbi:hypothetical protein D047_3110A, partial [Vibrio parahaemolyticus VPTS-2010_2]
MAGQVHN